MDSVSAASSIVHLKESRNQTHPFPSSTNSDNINASHVETQPHVNVGNENASCGEHNLIQPQRLKCVQLSVVNTKVVPNPSPSSQAPTAAAQMGFRLCAKPARSHEVLHTTDKKHVSS